MWFLPCPQSEEAKPHRQPFTTAATATTTTEDYGRLGEPSLGCFPARSHASLYLVPLLFSLLTRSDLPLRTTPLSQPFPLRIWDGGRSIESNGVIVVFESERREAMIAHADADNLWLLNGGPARARSQMTTAIAMRRAIRLLWWKPCILARSVEGPLALPACLSHTACLFCPSSANPCEVSVQAKYTGKILFPVCGWEVIFVFVDLVSLFL